MDLITVCQNGDLEYAKTLIEENNEDPCKPDKDGVTPLHTACMSGNLELVKFLIEEMGVEVDAIGLRKSTPLHFTSCKKIAEFLISKGANSEITNELGEKAWKSESSEPQTPEKCTAITQKKEPCKLKCVSGTLFCKRHTPKDSTPVRNINSCSAMTKKNEPCKLKCVPGTGLCKRHTPK
jgi:hypothetical protein